MTQPTCHYDSNHGWLAPEHRADCPEPDCPGCRPCGNDHCQLDGYCPNHVDHEAGIYTCPRCIGRAKRQVRDIVDRYALVELAVEDRGNDLGQLLEQAAETGIDSEAFNLIGPAADPAQWAERRRRLVKSYDQRGWCDYPKHDGLADDDPHHPYAVLGKWDMAMRESYGPQTDLLTNVDRAAAYLTGPLLEKFAHTHEFEDFVRDITRCLSHLEAVLQDSRQPERGAPCPTCRAESGDPDFRAKRLVKHYAEHQRDKGEFIHTTPCRCSEDTAGHCRICVGHEDTWHCPANTAHWWSDADYQARVDGDYLEHAEALTASQMHEAYGIRPGTLRQWALRRHVNKRGRNAQGQQLYDVAQAKAMHAIASISA